MTARVFDTVHNPKQGVDATLHVATFRDGYHVPLCGTRSQPKELVIGSGVAPEITCERCQKKLKKEGLT